MRSGRLRHRVTIQSRSATMDAAGGQPDTWTDVATVWAGVEPLSGREYLAASANNAEVTHKVTMRHRDGVTAAQRLAFGIRRFDILAVMDRDERGVELTLMCRERVP